MLTPMVERTSTLKGRITQRLKHLGMSKAGLARAVKESPQNVNNWLKRESIPTLKFLSVCNALQCRPEWLATGLPPVENGKREVDPAGLKDSGIGKYADAGADYFTIDSPLADLGEGAFQKDETPARPDALVPIISWVQAKDALLLKQLAQDGGRILIQPLSHQQESVFGEFRIVGKIIF